MYTPTATYRIQLSESFTLKQLKEQLDYFRDLGISTVYASPISQARSGSTHGYDVTNPLRINPEVGTEEELIEITRRLREHGMGWLQDIVPNHMAYDTVNPWIDDLLEKGPQSEYATYFDVNWEHPDPRYHGKIMAPFLGSTPEEVLAEQQLTLRFGKSGFQWHYYDHRFPLSVASYPGLLQELVASVGSDTDLAAKLTSWTERIKAYEDARSSQQPTAESWDDLKAGLFDAVSSEKEISRFVGEYHQDSERLTRLLEQQNFRLVHWKTTEQEINYRRFFTVNDLICLNAQRPEVFTHYHRKLKEWIEQGYVQGVRVDHIDGLLDPAGYLADLRSLLGEEIYIVVEKILEHDETLPDWPIQGSSGYEFLADASQLFTRKEGSKSLLSYYPTWNPPEVDYEALVYRNKSFILHQRMHGELDNLMRLLEQLDLIPADELSQQRDKLQDALAHVLTAFPVYRIYSTAYPFTSEEQAVVERAFAKAQQQAPDLASQLEMLRTIFRGEASDDEAKDQRRLQWVMRCQQFTGPLAAKGVEDTTFYQYFPLISHNEVGDSPHHLGMVMPEFHRRMQQRAPHAMNTTATHDTKRGEDARLRINLLSEVPSEWMKETARWRYANEPYKSGADEHSAWPTANFEYFIYQTLVGTYPFHASPDEENYEERLKAFLLKATREAKLNTSWSEPDEAYERAIGHFVTQMLGDQDFMNEFTNFARPLARMATTYSLGQTLLKATAPGIPDVYQGTEYWDLSMVDPDNRRPVNYRQRQDTLLQTLDTSADADLPGLLRRLNDNLLDPSGKLFVLSRSLRVRRDLPELFAQGTYEPLEVRGPQQKNLLAFRRSWQDQAAIVLIPVGVAQLFLTGHLPLGEAAWSDTQVILPEAKSGSWINIFTQQRMRTDGTLRVSDLLQDFPVALLTNQNQ